MRGRAAPAHPNIYQYSSVGIYQYVCVYVYVSSTPGDSRILAYSYSILQHGCVCEIKKLISKYIFFKPEIDELVVVLILDIKEHSQMTRVHSAPSFDVKQIN